MEDGDCPLLVCVMASVLHLLVGAGAQRLVALLVTPTSSVRDADKQFIVFSTSSLCSPGAKYLTRRGERAPMGH
jgi:hypothetical protein